jgi:ABC-type transporter Mla subunit MlaD
MARPYRELRERMSPEARKRAEELASRDLLEMDLAELRARVAGLTQRQVAEITGKTQSAIAQLEKRDDTLLRSLAEYVKALGGRLELVAHFEEQHDVRITQFEAVKEQLEQASG